MRRRRVRKDFDLARDVRGWLRVVVEHETLRQKSQGVPCPDCGARMNDGDPECLLCGRAMEEEYE